MPVFVGGRRLGLALVAALMAVGTAGCSGSSDSPTTLPPISTTPAPSQTSTPPQSPKAAAEAAVHQYFRLLNNLEHKMDVQAFARLESRTCPCRKLLASLRQAKARSQHYYGKARIRSISTVVDTATAAEVLVTYDSTAGGLMEDDGAIVTRAPGRVGITENFVLRAVAGRWVIVNLVAVDRGQPK